MSVSRRSVRNKSLIISSLQFFVHFCPFHAQGFRATLLHLTASFFYCFLPFSVYRLAFSLSTSCLYFPEIFRFNLAQRRIKRWRKWRRNERSYSSDLEKKSLSLSALGKVRLQAFRMRSVKIFATKDLSTTTWRVRSEFEKLRKPDLTSTFKVYKPRNATDWNVPVHAYCSFVNVIFLKR